MEVSREVEVVSQPALQEETDFEDELSLFAKRTNFDNFECSPFNLIHFSNFYEEMIQRLSNKLKTRATLTESESRSVELLRAIRRTVLGSWKDYLEKKEDRAVSDELRALFASNWKTQKRIALHPLP